MVCNVVLEIGKPAAVSAAAVSSRVNSVSSFGAFIFNPCVLCVVGRDVYDESKREPLPHSGRVLRPSVRRAAMLVECAGHVDCGQPFIENQISDRGDQLSILLGVCRDIAISVY
jgi:hypothetical protein